MVKSDVVMEVGRSGEFAEREKLEQCFWQSKEIITAGE